MDIDPPQPPHEVTRILERARDGEETAVEALWSIVYQELRRLAEAQLTRERSGHTLQPTALVNEAFLRLVGPTPVTWDNRAHFFGAAARAMRQVLVDYARARGRSKRGEGKVPLSLELEPEHATEAGSNIDLLALDEALLRLAVMDERMARVVELLFFAGLTVQDTARLLEVSPATVSGDWKIARMWLHRELTSDGPRR